MARVTRSGTSTPGVIRPPTTTTPTYTPPPAPAPTYKAPAPTAQTRPTNGLLNTTSIPLAPTYNDPRASVLYGSGNTNISDADIRAYASQPGLTGTQILEKALASGVSRDQYIRATGARPQDVDAAIAGYGISNAQTNSMLELPLPQAPEPEKVAFQPASFAQAKQDPLKGTVAGQLNTVLDPNSPLMQRAATFANQQMNSRGLLNSQGGITAAQAAMVDAGLQIATPDAAASNQFGLFNAGQQNDTNRFNSNLGAQVGMFNADLGSKVGMFNTGTSADILNRREANATSVLNNRESLTNNLTIANLDVDTKRMIAGIQARSEDSRYAASLYDTLIKLQSDLQKNPDIPADDKARMFGELVNTFNASLNVFDTIETTGVGNLLSNFKTSGTGESSRAAGGGESGSATGENQVGGAVTNVNNRQVDPVDVALFEKTNAKYGSPYKVEQLLSKSEVNDIVIPAQKNLGPTWRNLLQERYGVVEFTPLAKDGLSPNDSLWIYA